MPGARSMMAWGQGGQAGPPRKIKADTLKRIAKSFAPYRVKVYWTLLMVVAVVFLNVLPNWFLRIISDDGFLKNDLGVVARYSIYSLIAVVLLSVLTFAYGYISGDIGQRIMRDFRNQLFTHLQGMSLRFFTSSRTGEVQSRLLSDVAGVQNVVSDVVTNALANIGVVLASIAGMILLDWRLSLLAVGIIPIFAYLSNLAGEYARKTRRKTQQQTAEMNALMQETLSVSGILLTKTSGRRSLVQSKFSKENQGLADLQLRLQMVQYFFFGLTRMIFQITPALAYWLAAYLLDSKGQHITIGTLIAFTGFQARMLFPLSAILSVQVELTSSLALFDRIYEYLDMPQDIVDKPEAIELAPHDVKGKVEFDSIGFRYDPSSATETLKNISFTAESGTLTALVGPSGAGKTTLTYLIARLYDVDSGCVKIDGHDVRDLKLACIEQFVGAVTQETYLVHDTIRENLRYANPDATDDQIIEATKAAAIHDHIANLPEGYDTVVGERGYKLSGGEKQRMAIARAILKNPRILILDEATSALDTQSERTIQTSLNRLMVGRTTFAIAHRLSTILAADQILVVSGGEIVQRGRHEELVAVPGLYQHLYNEQFASIPAQTPSDLNAPELSTP